MLSNTAIVLLTTLLSPTAGERLGESNNFEVVSDEPLMFEPAEEVYPDRRLFEDVEGGELDDVDELEQGISFEEDFDEIQALSSHDVSDYEEVGEPLLFEPPSEVYVDRRRLKAGFSMYETHDRDELEAEPSDSIDEAYASTYDSEFEFEPDYDSSEWNFDNEGDGEDSQDHESLPPMPDDAPNFDGEVKPIARRLRRINNSQESSREHDIYVAHEEQNRNLQGCKNLKIEFKVDKFGKETTVELRKNGKTILQSRNEVGAYQKKTLTKCVPAGTYTLFLKDQDGFCCKYGKGYYKLSVNGQLLVSGGYFIGTKTHTIKVGHKPSMTSRDKEWLAAHNSRRRTYHQKAGVSYRALKWSTTLKADATRWAKSLLNSCSQTGIKHQKNIGQGENLAKNKGSGSFGKQYPANNILKRWVENESTWKYPKNAHLTQVVWRPTAYVGCADAAKSMGGNQMCRIQVCRYMKPGNCAIKNGNWRAYAFQDDSKCGDSCPREGCFA